VFALDVFSSKEKRKENVSIVPGSCWYDFPLACTYPICTATNKLASTTTLCSLHCLTRPDEQCSNSACSCRSVESKSNVRVGPAAVVVGAQIFFYIITSRLYPSQGRHAERLFCARCSSSIVHACVWALPLNSTHVTLFWATTVAHVTRPGVVEGPAPWSTDAGDPLRPPTSNPHKFTSGTCFPPANFKCHREF
jgi:hypothetical protein